jgi:hypothetical protein
MVYNVHITFFWGWAKKPACLPVFQQWANQLLALTFLAKSSSGISAVTASDQGPHGDCSFFSSLSHAGPCFHQMIPRSLCPRKRSQAELWDAMVVIQLNELLKIPVLVTYKVGSGPYPQEACHPVRYNVRSCMSSTPCRIDTGNHRRAACCSLQEW